MAKAKQLILQQLLIHFYDATIIKDNLGYVNKVEKFIQCLCDNNCGDISFNQKLRLYYTLIVPEIDRDINNILEYYNKRIQNWRNMNKQLENQDFWQQQEQAYIINYQNVLKQSFSKISQQKKNQKLPENNNWKTQLYNESFQQKIIQQFQRKIQKQGKAIQRYVIKKELTDKLLLILEQSQTSYVQYISKQLAKKTIQDLKKKAKQTKLLEEINIISFNQIKFINKNNRSIQAFEILKLAVAQANIQAFEILKLAVAQAKQAKLK